MSNLKFVNHILDNVHGSIGLTSIENQIERLPVFKRLHDISQLGLVSWVFPGALHTRYLHSLGVMHVVDQMAQRVEFVDGEEPFTAHERQLLRLAGMLHDIGHYPLSHDVEYAYGSNVEKISFDSILLTYRDNALEGAEDLNKSQTSQPKRFMQAADNLYHHERMGTEVIVRCDELRKYIEEGGFDVNDIAAIITGNQSRCMISKENRLSLMIQMMHSELDADRIDYLLRDATFSGTAYGQFDFDLLSQNMAARKIMMGNQTSYILGITPKGACCAEQLLYNRYLSYAQVIHHKYAAILGCMVQTCCQWMMYESSATKFPKASDVSAYIEGINRNKEYLKFTDRSFFEYVEKIDPNYGCPSDIQKMFDTLKKRCALNVADEHVFSGLFPERILEELGSAPLYRQAQNEKPDGIFQFREVRLTKHVPLAMYEARIDTFLTNTNTKGEELSKEDFLLDRLQEGVALIEKGKEPILLVDSSRSNLRDIYSMRYILFRKYALS